MDRKEWKNLLQELSAKLNPIICQDTDKRGWSVAAPSEKSREEIHWTDPHFHRQVLEEGKEWRRCTWISQNKSGGRSHTFRYRTEDSAMQAEEIHEQDSRTAGLAEVTVKYHCRETYRKLGVNGKAAAVNEARKRKLI